MHSTVRLPPAPALVAGRVRPRLCGPATYRSKASCRGLGQDAASGFLDVAKLVSGSVSPAPHLLAWFPQPLDVDLREASGRERRR